ncbi:MAG: lamin tail domain-containing protein, partial [Planctomycetales bacterium]|nr:lamin tail domain-containing protein [Planctomycetales bacterium]
MLDATGLRITELMASNDDVLQDFEGESSDWLEIYNPSAATVDLEGLFLTDDSADLSKWAFPSGASVAPGGYLVVFASGKDLTAPNGELHTNFRLSADGEYLGLVDGDGFTIIDQYAPEFPLQVEDISYGLEMSSAPSFLVSEGDAARAWVPTSASNDATWKGVGFDDSVFNIVGPSGFGYENSTFANPSYANYYNTAVPSGTAGLYVRVPFELESVEGLGQLTLRMKYDDGFVAYPNGERIASSNAPTTLGWTSTATAQRSDSQGVQY